MSFDVFGIMEQGGKGVSRRPIVSMFDVKEDCDIIGN
jgi:hypothetical protein